MPHTITKVVYYFDELEAKAKDRARQWCREWMCCDDTWYDSTFEDVQEVFKLLGVIVSTSEQHFVRADRTVGHVTVPDIYFSGFYQQGDGASYAGSYEYAQDSLKAVQGYAPQDTELHRIASELDRLNAAHGLLRATIPRGRGTARHSCAMSFEVYTSDGGSAGDRVAEALAELLRDLANWVYKQLKADFEYQMSDENVDETLRINEYEFDEQGRRST